MGILKETSASVHKQILSFTENCPLTMAIKVIPSTGCVINSDLASECLSDPEDIPWHHKPHHSLGLHWAASYTVVSGLAPEGIRVCNLNLRVPQSSSLLLTHKTPGPTHPHPLLQPRSELLALYHGNSLSLEPAAMTSDTAAKPLEANVP